MSLVSMDGECVRVCACMRACVRVAFMLLWSHCYLKQACLFCVYQHTQLGVSEVVLFSQCSVDVFAYMPTSCLPNVYAFVLCMVGESIYMGSYCIGMYILYTWACVADVLCVCIAEQRGGELMSMCE